MSTNSFTLKIYTPAGLVREEVVKAVNLPSSKGEIGILPQHAKYTGLIGIGILEYTTAESDQKAKLVVAGGFCNFSMDTLTILADGVDIPESVNRDSLGTDRLELEKVLETTDTSSDEWILAHDRLARVEAIEKL